MIVPAKLRFNDVSSLETNVRLLEDRVASRGPVIGLARLQEVLSGCPDGATSDALLLNGFSESDLDHASALCLVRTQRSELVGGIAIIRYWGVRR